MPLSNLDLKRVYYYVICVMAFFVLMWGVVDLGSSAVSLLSVKLSNTTVDLPAGEAPATTEKGEQFFDTYYQSKMLTDRLWDSLGRILVSGLIFGYCRFTVNKLEREA